ncbi:hypothetical protein ACHAWF_012502 [Thalassiosira exigua]
MTKSTGGGGALLAPAGGIAAVAAAAATARSSSSTRVTRSSKKKRAAAPVATTTPPRPVEEEEEGAADAAGGAGEPPPPATTSLTPALEESKLSPSGVAAEEGPRAKLEEEAAERTTTASSADEPSPCALEIVSKIETDDGDAVMTDAAAEGEAPSSPAKRTTAAEEEGAGGPIAPDDAMEVDPAAGAEGASAEEAGAEGAPPAPIKAEPPDEAEGGGGEDASGEDEGGDDEVGDDARKGREDEDRSGDERGAVVKSESDAVAASRKLTGVSADPSAPAIGGSSAGGASAGGGGSTAKRGSDAGGAPGAAAAAATTAAEATAEQRSPSFSMTLAIGPEEARRVFQASRAFNAELNKLRREDEARFGSAAKEKENATVGATAAATEGRGEKGPPGEEEEEGGEGGELRKRKPAIVHSPPTRGEPLTPPPGTRTGGDDDVASSSEGVVAAGADRPPLPRAGPRPLRDLLLPAARGAGDPLIASFLGRMERLGKDDGARRTCLLFFLDADKSTKLMAAFDVLGEVAAPEGKGKGGTGKEEEGEGRGAVGGGGSSSSKLVRRPGLIRLFQSFLTSISTCVHGEEGADADGAGEGGLGGDGGSGDWKGSERTQREILEVATFAAGNLVERAREEDGGGGGGGGDGGEEPKAAAAGSVDGDEGGVSFDAFGRWYNSGGFSLVPWLELLDLSKWDYGGGGGGDDGKDGAAAAGAGGGGGGGGGGGAVRSSSSSSTRSSSSSKRARIHGEPLTPAGARAGGGGGAMAEPIGSPTALFASGALLGATPQTGRKEAGGRADGGGFDDDSDGGGGGGGDGGGGSGGGVRSFSAMFGEVDESRTVVSFDFSGSAPDGGGPGGAGDGGAGGSSFHIDITEENLVMLRNLVRRTGLASLPPQRAEQLMMKHARVERRRDGDVVHVISRQQFGKFVREVVPKEASRRFDPVEIENFSNYFTNFFTCFDYSWSDLKRDEVDAKELAVGLSFLLAGNKSSKLAAAYDMLDVERKGYLTQRGLTRYLRSYLTMLAGISLLSASKRATTQIRKRLMSPRRDDAFLAVENGAKWTLSHFLKAFEADHPAARGRNSTRANAVTFEDFARWYTEGGYAVAPWLELLDLHKFLSLIGDNPAGGPRQATAEATDPTLGEVLFTFPLVKNRSLIVLRDDAQYVKTVVNELGLLSLTSEDIWRVLYKDASNSLLSSTKTVGKKSVRMEVDRSTFVQCMMRILSGTGKMKEHSSWAQRQSPEETLRNFFLSYDLSENDRVPLNQLMCGLTLLCGGKKSEKLVFAFGLFGADDAGKNGKRRAVSLSQNEFFFFFRSFLIVMFSCCNQSLSLNGDTVTQYISDTAKSVAVDVIAYWKAKKVEKVKFENFSEWYNEGGFETAPWLELLDLNKWVLAEEKPDRRQSPPEQPQEQPRQHRHEPLHQPAEQQLAPPATPAPKPAASSSHTPGLTPGAEAIKALLASPEVKANGSSPSGDCPPAPPDDDPLFDLDMSAVDAEVDEMDFILQQESAAHDSHVENVAYMDPAPAAPVPAPHLRSEPSNALKFNLLTHDEFGGYMISIGPDQVQSLHRIVTETGLCQVQAPSVCKFILYDSKSRKHNNLTRKSFQSAMKRVFDFTFKSSPTSSPDSIQEELSSFTEKLFTSFDRRKTSKINAVELACGFTVLCGGRKSDKLEHVFELLDEDKDTLVSRPDIIRFIKSFLVMLMSVSSSFTHLYGGACDNDFAAVSHAIEAGSEWAASQVFDALQPKASVICFDDFADWYTKGGYQSMPWLELLDLRKWCLS